MTKMRKNSNLIFAMVLVAIFGALDYVVTAFLPIPIPATSGAGYINLSDMFVFVVASLINPWIGGIVGAIAGFLSDITAGYGYFAPFTLMIKFIEGVVSGFLFRFLTSFGKQTKRNLTWKALVAFIIGGLMMAALYMIPDYVTYVLTPNSAPDKSALFIFIDLGFNSLQGITNAILGTLAYLGLYHINGLRERHQKKE
jgi:uncharacterized membrane protein